MTCVKVKRGHSRIAAVVLLVSACVYFAACGGKGGQIPVLGAVTIELTANSNTFPPRIAPGATLTISATVFDPNKGGVTWTVLPLTFGQLSKATSDSVDFTAPSSFAVPTTVTVTATSVTNPNVTASLQISASPIGVLLVTPGTQSTNLLDVPLPDQTIAAGNTILVGADIANDTLSKGITWSLSPPGAGSLSVLVNGPFAFQVNYTSPSTVSAPTTATLTATSVADSNATASIRITTLPSGGGSNVATIHVNGGPVPGQVYANGAFINGVMICNPGSVANLTLPVCQSVDGILVDTGSYGLRILQSQIPLLSLPALTGVGVTSTSNTLENCYSFTDGSFVWGPVSRADVYIAGQMASQYITTLAANAAIVQVISSTSTGVPDGCSNGGTDLNTPQLLGVNGILGIGPEPTDCTLAGVNYCDGSVQPVAPNIYYSCPKGGCAPTDTPVLVSQALHQQVTNLLPLFGQIRAVIDLPPVAGSEPTVDGTLTFGGFAPSGATTYTLDSNNNFTTIVNGQNLTGFIDSGSSALYFPDNLPSCSVSISFFCPAAQTPISATIQGNTQGQGTVDFAVDNADNLFSTYPGFAALTTLAGPASVDSCSSATQLCTFDWGLPFFYGRPVLMKVDSCTPPPNVCSDLQGPTWTF